MSLFAELKRRNVFRVGIAYLLMGWVLLQGADFVLDLIGAPDWVIRVFALAVAIGLPVALFFAWAFELTPEGIKRESEVDRSASIAPRTGRRLDRLIIAFLALAVTVLLAERFLGGRSQDPAVPDEPPAAASPTAPATRPSVAVLPFDFRSNDPDDAFFAEGIHDDLLTQLAKIGSLKVISRTSVMEYQDTTKKIPEIARELGVATIVEGGVQRSGSRIRLNAQLIDAATDEHLWAESFDRELTAENLFDIQAEISRAIASALQATLSPAEEAELERPLTDNLEAWQSYQRALRMRYKQDIDALESGLTAIDHALSLDPQFANAWGLKAVLVMMKYWFLAQDPGLRETAWSAIATGRRIDPGLADLDVAEGYYHYWGFQDYERALESLDRAVDKRPGDASVHLARGFVLRRMGAWEACVAAFRKVAELNPRDVLVHGDIASTLARLKRFEEAGSALAEALRLAPDSSLNMLYAAEYALYAEDDLDAALRYLSLAPKGFGESYKLFLDLNLMKRDFDVALAAVADWPPQFLDVRTFHFTPAALEGYVLTLADRDAEAQPLLEAALAEYETLLAEREDYPVHATHCLVLGALGRAAAARQACVEAQSRLPRDAFIESENYHFLAISAALAGADELALEFLETALSLESGITVPPVERHPAFDGLRSLPGYAALIARYAKVLPP